jgi:hypothetical protein
MRYFLKHLFCNIKFVVILALVASCGPKAQNKSEPEDLKTNLEYETKNKDRELQVENGAFDIKKTIGLEKAENGSTPWLANSSDIFRVAEKSILLGDVTAAEKRNEFKKFGHQLLQLFYASKDNATQFDKNGTIYLPAAMGFEGEQIKDMLSSIGNDENIKKIQNIFSGCENGAKDCLKLEWPATQPTLRPVEFIISIKNYLNKMVRMFGRAELPDSFVKSFKAQIQKDYLVTLEQGEKDLQQAGLNQRLLENSEQIIKVMSTLTFLPSDILNKILVQLNKAHDYGVLLDKNAKGEGLNHRMVKVICSIWLDLSPEQREMYIKPANAELYNKLLAQKDDLLNKLSGRQGDGYATGESIFVDALESSCHAKIHDKLLAWKIYSAAEKTKFSQTDPVLFNVFSHYSQQEIDDALLTHYSDNKFSVSWLQSWGSSGDIVEKFVEEIAPICIDDVDDLVDAAANKYVLMELDKQIRAWGSMIEKAVGDKTVGGLQGIQASLKNNDSFVKYFSDVALKQPLVGELFDNQTLNGVENSRVQLFVSNKEKFQTRAIKDSHFQTGAETLGLALTTSALRIPEMKEYENIDPKDPRTYKVIFPQVNKMLAMIGFKDIYHKLVPSLHRLFYGNHPELDVFRYDCNDEKLKTQEKLKAENPNSVTWRDDCQGATDFNNDTYAIPDELAMASPFVPQDGVYPKKASAVAQAELIRGAALMMNYFHDWKSQPDGYDEGMGQEQYNGIRIFPRTAFVNLTLGLVTTPIRGFKKKNTPVRLFNLNGDEIEDWVDKDIFSKDKKKPKPPELELREAVIVDFSPGGLSSKVTAKDLASYMIAIDEFVKATNGIEQTKAGVVNPPDRKERDVLHAIQDGRKQLQQLVYGMATFLVNRMQADDGGFYHSYSLATHKPNTQEPRSLEDQAIVIQALLRTHNEWALHPTDDDFSVLKSLEAYYFMNQNLWNDNNGFYVANEASKSVEVEPQVYMDTLLTIHQLLPFLPANSREQAKKIFDFYTDQFLKWNQGSQPLAMEPK